MSGQFYFCSIYDCSGGKYTDDFFLQVSNDANVLINEAIFELREGGYEGASVSIAELGKKCKIIWEDTVSDDLEDYTETHPMLDSPPETFYWCRYCNILYETPTKCKKCENTLYDSSGDKIKELDDK
jgi:hypothetical protein